MNLEVKTATQPENAVTASPKTPSFQGGDEGEERFQASADMDSKADVILSRKPLTLKTKRSQGSPPQAEALSPRKIIKPQKRHFPRFIIVGSIVAYTCLLNAGTAQADGGVVTNFPEPAPVTSSISFDVRPPQEGGSAGLESQSPEEIFEILKITEDGVIRYIATRRYLQLGGTVGLEDKPPHPFLVTKTVENGIASFSFSAVDLTQATSF